MNLTLLAPARMVVRVCFVLLLVLGLLIWFANMQLELLHIGVGLIFVLAMWTIAISALTSRPEVRPPFWRGPPLHSMQALPNSLRGRALV